MFDPVLLSAGVDFGLNDERSIAAESAFPLIRELERATDGRDDRQF